MTIAKMNPKSDVPCRPALPEFDYIRPGTLAEACQFLAQHPNSARPFLGGTDVFVRMRDGFFKPQFLVDVKYLDGMNALRFDPSSGLTIGAAVNMNQVAACQEVQQHYPLLAEACCTVASYQLRTRATIVGNICNASPAGDTLGTCLALQGVLHIQGVESQRSEALSAFFLGPGKTTLKAGEIVTAIHFPLPPQGSAGTYIKLGRNRLSDLAIVGVTVMGYPDQSAPSGYRFRLALASVAPVPLVPVEAEAYLAEHPITPEVLREAAGLASRGCKPIDDVRGGARYRQAMVKNLVRQGLEKVWAQLSIIHER